MLNRLLTLFPVLKARYDNSAAICPAESSNNSAIARALLTMPRLLIVDEPSLGLAPNLSNW